MTKTYLYVARHGKTMFNTLGRAQGWSDTPLTAKGVEGIRELGRGLKAKGISFERTFSSDSGRTLETLDIILDQLDQQPVPHTKDKRIREWCFGSLDGAYDAELFLGVLPLTKAFENGKSFSEVTYPELAASLLEVDTAGWAQPWEVLRDRIWSGFEDIAESMAAAGGGNALVVCHGMTIATLLWLIDDQQEKVMIDNGSVTLLAYEDGKFSIEAVADLSYRQLGRELLDRESQ